VRWAAFDHLEKYIIGGLAHPSRKNPSNGGLLHWIACLQRSKRTWICLQGPQ
jgi:hypothetical protein